MSLLNQIIDRLDHRAVPRDKFPDAKGNYWAHCPFHNDTHPTNFSVCAKGYVCFACGARGGLRQLADKLGIEPPERAHARTENGGAPHDFYSLAQYSQDKRLPVDFLRSLGLTDRRYNGGIAVRIPYRDAAGEEVAVRYRIAATGDKFRWNKGAKLIPYGLDRLDRTRGYVHIVEGESDCHTLWYHGEPALGVPGATTWKDAWQDYLQGLTVYIWQELDFGGLTMMKDLARSLPNAMLIKAPTAYKDPSAAHLGGEDIPAFMARERKKAWPVLMYAVVEQYNMGDFQAERAGELVNHPDILSEFSKLCQAQGLVGEERTAKLLYLAVTSRLLDRPVSVAVKGPSSGGKSFTVETVLKAFPPSAYYALTAMSEHALAYMEEPLEHRMLVLYEAAGLNSDIATYLIRSLLSEGHIRYETVEKTSDGLKSRSIDRPGPTGLILTTTAASLHPENETRLFSVTVRDTPEQTARIIAALAEARAGRKSAPVDLQPWHALQLWLEQEREREVVIPYATELADRIAKRAVRQRRDFGAVLNLISAHALLHKETRQRDPERRIIATLADYAAAYELVIDIISEGSQASVKPEVREAVEAVKRLDQPGNPPITYKRVAEELGMDRAAAERRCKVALQEGYLINRQTIRGQAAILTVGEPLPQDEAVLPKPEDLKLCDAPPFSVRACARADATRPEAARSKAADPAPARPQPPPSAPPGEQPPGEQPPLPYEAADDWQRSFLDEADSIWDPENC